MSTLLKWAFGASGDVPIVSSNVFNQQVYTGDGTGDRNIVTGVDLSDSSSRWVWNTGLSSGIGRDRYNTYTTTDFLSFNSTVPAIVGTLISTYSTDGYRISSSGVNLNILGATYLSLCFKRSPKFFDRFTYTGDGTTNRSISHSLGVAPGIIFIKSRTSVASWEVWHTGWGQGVTMNMPTGGPNTGMIFNVTATTFTVNSASVNQNGDIYDAYLLANDSAATSLVKCGAYTGNATTQNVTLGWRPQFLLIKCTSDSRWSLIVGTNSGSVIDLSTNSLPVSNTNITLTSTGFTVSGTQKNFNANGVTYAYTAIKE